MVGWAFLGHCSISGHFLQANSVYSSESEECKSASSRSLRSSLSSMKGPGKQLIAVYTEMVKVYKFGSCGQNRLH